MPKRVVDGDALWRSHKLRKVEPAKYRAEFANLIPMALANGVFEAEPELVWAEVYSFNRPDIQLSDVISILDEFERVGLLCRWQDVNGIQKELNGSKPEGKVWGYWIGIEKPGRLPGASRRGKNERIGPTPPLSVDSIKRSLESSERSKGTDLCLGSGFGSGSGNGSGVSEQSFSLDATVSYVMVETGLAGKKIREVLYEVIKREIDVVGIEPRLIANTMIVAWSTYDALTLQYKLSPENFFGNGTWRKPADQWNKAAAKKPVPLANAWELKQKQMEGRE